MLTTSKHLSRIEIMIAWGLNADNLYYYDPELETEDFWSECDQDEIPTT